MTTYQNVLANPYLRKKKVNRRNPNNQTNQTVSYTEAQKPVNIPTKVQKPTSYNPFNQYETGDAASGMYGGITAPTIPDALKQFMTPKQDLTIDQFADKYGFDYSKDYAKQLADTMKQSKHDNLTHNQRLVDNNVMSAAESLDRNYYLKGLQQQQQQTNSGLNAGIAADQNLRLAMSRQAALGDVYRDSNAEKARINDELGRLDSEALAYADELYNTRRQQGYNNLQNERAYNQQANQDAFGNYMNYWGMKEDIRRNDRNFNEDSRRWDNEFALEESQVTGTYVPVEARGLVQELLNLKQQAEGSNDPELNKQLSARADVIRNELASRGMDTSKMSANTGYMDMRNNFGANNRTVQERQRLFGNAVTEGQLTGNYMPFEARELVNTILEAKRVAEDNNQSRADRTQAHKAAVEARNLLASMGMDVGAVDRNTSYNQALGLIGSMNPTLDKQGLEYENALNTGKLTGTYIDPRANGLLQELLNTKRNAEQRGKATEEEKEKADQLRAQLEAMGVPANAIAGSNVGYAEALKRIGAAGTTTLDKYMFNNELAWDRSKFGQELAWDKSRFGQELSWDKDKFGQGLQFDYDQMAQDAQLTREQLALDRQLGQWDYSLGEAELDLRNAQLIVEEKYRQAETSNKSKLLEYEQNTNAVIADLQGKSKAEVLEAFKELGQNWVNNGVDVVEVMRALGVYGLLKDTSSSGGSTGAVDYQGEMTGKK